MPFPGAIQQTPALKGNHTGAAPFHAPAIAAGDPTSPSQLLDAEREVHERASARVHQGHSVTAAQLHASKKRKMAIEFSHAHEEYGEAMIGAPVTKAMLDQQTATVTATITATIRAESARRLNTTTALNNDNARLRRIPKTVKNDPQNPPPVGVPNAAIGQVCPPNIFPATKAAIHAMTQADITNLCAWYNQDLGIKDGDDIREQRRLVEEFVYWG